jgi:hypothetical protein
MLPMAPLGAHEAGPYERQLIAQVIESLSMHLMENAKFMAERLHADFPNEVRHHDTGLIRYNRLSSCSQTL